MQGFTSKAASIKRFLFTDKEWAGFTWLLKILSVYLAAGIIVILLYEYSPAGHYLAPLLTVGAFPVYVLIIGLLLGIPAFNLCRAAITRYETKRKALPLILVIMAGFCACVIIPQIFLSRLLPVFTSILALLFICFFFLFGCWAILKLIVKEIRGGIKSII